jgi:hypothetical protein
MGLRPHITCTCKELQPSKNCGLSVVHSGGVLKLALLLSEPMQSLTICSSVLPE